MLGLSRTVRFGAATALAVAFSPAIALAQQAFESPAAAKLEVTSTSEEASRHFWAGVHDADNIFFTRAATHFEKALELDATFGMARVLHARNAPGLSQADRIAKINKGIAELSEASTGELLTALGMREWTAGNPKEAKALFGTASKMMPGDPHLALYKAFVTGAATNPEMGIAAVRDVTERFPEFAAAWNILGYQLWQSGDRAGGLAAIKKYAALAPDHPNPHDSYAELLQWTGRYDEAMKHYRRAAELDPSFDQAYMGMAEIAQLTGNGKQARQYLTQASEHAATDGARLHRLRAIAASHLIDGNPKAALAQLESVAAMAEKEGNNNVAALAHQQMAAILAMTGKGKTVEAHLAKAAELGGADNPGQLAYTAMAHASLGHADAATQASEKLAKAAYDGGQNLKQMSHAVNGMVYLRSNQLDKALAELAQADPSDYMVKAMLASCYKKMGQKAQAMALRDEVLNDRQFSLQDPLYPLARMEAATK